MKTYVTEIQNDIPLFFIQAGSFPEGIKAAHEKLRSMIGQDNGRILYGISRPEDGKIIYRAGAEEQYAGEGARYNCDLIHLKKRQIHQHKLSELPGKSPGDRRGV